MTELSLELFLAVFSPAMSIIFVLLGLVLNYLRSIEKTSESTATIIGIANKDKVIDYYREKTKKQVFSSGGDGAPPEQLNRRPLSEKEILLGKLEDGTINPSEAQRLRAILEQEAANARATGAIVTLFAILGLIALIAIISDSG